MIIKKFILIACAALFMQSCRKDEPVKPGRPENIRKEPAAVNGYIINGTIKNVSGADGLLFNYELELWVAEAARPNIPLLLPGDLEVTGTLRQGGIANQFTVKLTAGTTSSKIKYRLTAPVSVTGKFTSPASYQGKPISFTGKFTEILAPADITYPTLLFGFNDLPAIREKVQSGWLASSYAKMKSQADKFLLVKTNPYFQNNAIAGRNMHTQVNDLALAGYIANDSRYINKAIEIMCAAAKQWDPAFYDNLNPHLNVADAAHAYAIGYDWLYPYMTHDERTLIKNEIEEFGLWIYNCSLSGAACYGDYGKANLSCNHNAVVHGALGLCALVLGDKPAWKDLAITHIRGYFENSLDDDGYNYEGISYFAYGSLGSVPFSVALLRKGGPDLVDESPRNKLVPNYILRQVFPWGGSVVAMNDSDPDLGSFGGYMHLVAKYHDRVGLWTFLRLTGPPSGGGNGTYGVGVSNGTYLGNGSTLPYVILFADKDLQPQSPAAAGLPPGYFFTSKGANPGGRVSFRSGWGDLDALTTFTSGPDRHRGHNHRDENSFTFYSLGEEFGIDPKYQPWETKSHNTILVDGYGQGNERVYDVAGNIEAHADLGNAYYVKGEAADPYLNASKVSIARRQLLFVKGVQPYLIIADDIQKSAGTGVFKWMFHTTPLNQFTFGPGQNAVITGSNRNAKCYIKFLWPKTGVTLSQTDLTGQTIDRYGRLYPYDKYYKEMQATVSAVVNPRFVTFVSAAEAGQNPPQISFTGTPDNMQITVTSKDGKVDKIGVTRANMTFSRQ